MNPAEIAAKARDLGLSIADDLAALVKPALLLELTNDSASCAPLASRLGGQPALPKSMSWPTRAGKPLSCVAQINLAELASIRTFDALPSDGLLVFFYDADAQPWGFTPEDKDGFAVKYVPSEHAPSVVAPWPDGLPEALRFPDCGVTFRETQTLPSVGAASIAQRRLPGDQLELYEQLLSDISDGLNQGSRSLVLGHPDQIQLNDLFDDLPLVTAGINTGGAVPNNAKTKQLREQAKNWRLLLQVETLEAANMYWGDMGCLYFCIEEQALRALDFDSCWLVLQCS